MEVHVANVAQIPRQKVKSDVKDAERLLRLWRNGDLPESYLPEDELQRLRDLGRHRVMLAEESRRFKSKIKHDLYKHGHFVKENPLNNEKGRAWLRTLDFPEIRSALRIWENLQVEIDEFQRLIEKETTDHPVAKRLMTVPGIGAYTALVILAEVADFKRFPDGDHLASYAGLTPSLHQSGDHARTGDITKMGNPTLRFFLVEAAHNHVRSCPDSRLSMSHFRIEEKRGKGKAIVATARQLCRALWTMMDREEDFKVNP